MPSEKNKTLKFNQYVNTDTIYADLECLIKKICGCVNNPAKSLTTKIGENIPCGQQMYTIWEFDHIEDTSYRGKYCIL